MNKKKFEFSIYRLNIVEMQLSLIRLGQSIKSDDEIIYIIKSCSNSAFDQEQVTRTATYRWSIRDVICHKNDNLQQQLIICSLSRSLVRKHGEIVTDQGLTKGISESTPPLATSILLIFYIDRHLLSVEHNSIITNNDKWKKYACEILNQSAIKLGYDSKFSFEEVSDPQKLIKEFNSYSKVTRLKVKLRLPNPELTRYTKALFEEMRRDGLREYDQDMRNPWGISKNEEGRPYSAIALAEAGYKNGSVIISGVRNNKRDKSIIGKKASRLTVSISDEIVTLTHDDEKMMMFTNIMINKINEKHPQEIKK